MNGVCASHASSQRVWKRRRVTSGSSRQAWCSAVVVGTPSTSSSPRRAPQPGERRLARLVPDDQLAEQRIVERRHRIAG